MGIDSEARALGDLAHDRAKAGVVDVPVPATDRADDMVVMDGLARDIRVIAARQVDTLDRPQFGQDVERPEDGGATDAQATRVRVGDKVGRGEVAIASSDQAHDRTPRGGDAVAGPVQGCVDGRCVHVHDDDDTQYQYGRPVGLPRRLGTPGTTGPSSGCDSGATAPRLIATGPARRQVTGE